MERGAQHVVPQIQDKKFAGGGGGGARLRPKKQGSIDRPPQNPTEADPWAAEVTRTQNSAKNGNGILGISASGGFREVIICHVSGERNLTIFNAQKTFRRQFIMADS